MHGLLDGERAAIVELFNGWAEVDRSHRKLAARGSRVGLVHAAASTVRRVLRAEQIVLPGIPAREPVARTPWPDWLVWKPNSIWCYDFTHFPRAKCAAIAVMDVASRRWLSTLVSVEQTSTQVEVAFLAAIDAEGLSERIDARLLAQLRGRDRAARRPGRPRRRRCPGAGGDERQRAADALPLHPGVHGRLRDHATLRPPRHPHRPGLDRDPLRARQGRVPHLEKIRDPADLRLELDRVKEQYNTVRHAGIGYVTPDDEHHGRGDAIRQARRDGLTAARHDRIAYRRSQRKEPS